MNRRSFISLSALAGAVCISEPSGWSALSKSAPTAEAETFDFIFFTDTHIQPELDAAHGCTTCFEKLRSHKADFAIQGGDHVYDALGASAQRATDLYELYARTEKLIEIPVYHTIGNHDAFAAYAKTGVPVSDPRQGKRMYQQRVGKLYYSFDHKGYHFVVLDTIQLTDDRSWEARIDEPQLAWLAQDLSSVAPGTPVIIVVHCPLTTGALAYSAHDMGKPPKYQQAYVANAYAVIALLEKHNVVLVLQGHIHINEVVTYKGIPFVTSGAVSGDWWHGSHWGSPEGYTVVSLKNGGASWRYETYGFKTIAPRND